MSRATGSWAGGRQEVGREGDRKLGRRVTGSWAGERPEVGREGEWIRLGGGGRGSIGQFVSLCRVGESGKAKAVAKWKRQGGGKKAKGTISDVGVVQLLQRPKREL